MHGGKLSYYWGHWWVIWYSVCCWMVRSSFVTCTVTPLHNTASYPGFSRHQLWANHQLMCCTVYVDRVQLCHCMSPICQLLLDSENACSYSVPATQMLHGPKLRQLAIAMGGNWLAAYSCLHCRSSDMRRTVQKLATWFPSAWNHAAQSYSKLSPVQWTWALGPAFEWHCSRNTLLASLDPRPRSRGLGSRLESSLVRWGLVLD